MKWGRHIVYVSFILLFVQFSLAQKTEDDIRDEANKLFEQEEYIQATPLFLQLTSLNPKSHDYNFKYGTCLLFNSNQKNKGLRYLNYAIKDPNIDNRAYYYRGKALHLDYQFDLAKKSYQRYLNEVGRDADPRFETERFVQMCENGKRLLTQFTDIVVADKKEIDQNKFFRIYTDAETVKGYILVSEQFQSKIDKKKEHIPVVHFPPDASAVYYASYGDNESNGLDVFVRKKLPDGEWGLEQRLPGEVNTQYDENFPYLHPSGRFLYFSSKGHNSMGGYDIFMSRYRDDTYDWGPPENIDFAISSPDDDLFYVVDSLFQNAYFASARQSQDGKLHVYKVKVVRVPIQEVIVMGDFESTINPSSAQMFVKLSETKSGKQVAETESNAQNKYAIVFPQGGRYNYDIEITTSQQTRTFTVELPFQDELRPLKQKILHTMEDGQEVVKVINLFDEEVEGAQEIIANLIRKKAELEVNIENFDLDKLEEEQRKKEILSELGYNNMRPDEIVDQLLELQSVQDENEVKLAAIKSNIDAAIIEKSELIAKLEGEQKELESQIVIETDPIKKHQLLSVAKQKEYEKRNLSDQIEKLNEFEAETVTKISKGLSDDTNIKDIIEAFNSKLQEEGELDALRYLKSNQQMIENVENSSPEKILDDLISERVKTNNSLDRVKYEEGKMDRRIDQLQSEINILESNLFDAKRKEVPLIESDISNNKREIEALQEEKKIGESMKKNLAQDLNKLDSQISTMQKAIRQKDPIIIDELAYEAALQKAEENKSDQEQTIYDNEIEDIEKDYPELANNNYNSESLVMVAAISEIKREASRQDQKIASTDDLSDEQKIKDYIDNITQTINKIDRRIEYLESEIASQPASNTLEQELKELKEYKIKQEGKKFEYETQLSELSIAETTENEINESEIWEEYAPDYQDELNAIEYDEELTKLGKTEAMLSTEEKLQNDLDQQLESIKGELDQNPANAQLENKKRAIESALQNSYSRAEDLKTQANSIIAQETGSSQSSKELIDEVDEAYAAEYRQIIENNSLDDLQRENQLLALDVEFLKNAEKLSLEISEQIERDQKSSTLIDKKNSLAILIAEKEEQIAERVQTINALQGESSVDNLANEKQEIIERINPEFETTIKKLANEKLTEQTINIQIAAYEDMLSALEKELKSVRKKLKKDPESNEYKRTEDAITELIEDYRNELSELEIERTALQNESEILASNKELIEELNPEYSDRIQELEKINESILNAEDIVELQRQEEELIGKLEQRFDAVNETLQLDSNDKEIMEEKEQLELLLTVLKNRTDQRSERLEALSKIDEKENIELLKEKILREVEPNYLERTKRIEEEGLSASEKVDLKIELEQDVIKGLRSERDELLSINERQPENKEVETKVNVVNDLIAEYEARLEVLQNNNVSNQEVNSSFKNTSTLIEEIAPDYESRKLSIESNNDIDQLTKLEELQQLETDLLTIVGDEIESKKEQLNTTGGSQLSAEIEQLEDFERSTKSKIEIREKEIIELSSSLASNPLQLSKEDILNEISEDYNSSIETINNSELPSLEKAIQLLEKEVALKREIEKSLDQTESELSDNRGDQNLNKRLEALLTVQKDNDAAIIEQKEQIRSEISNSELSNQILSDIDPNYVMDITVLERSESSTKYVDLSERELILQDKLKEEIEKQKENQTKNYSVDVDVELLAMEKLLEESKTRQTDFTRQNDQFAQNTATKKDLERTNNDLEIPEQQTLFVAKIREEGLGRLASEIEMKYTDEESLRKQNAILSRYEKKLQNDIEAIESGQEETSSQEQGWINNELDLIKNKRRSILVSIGELETEIMTESLDPEINKLNQEEEKLKDIAMDANASLEQKAEAQERIEEIEIERTERENELIKEKIDQQINEQKAVSNELTKIAEESGSISLIKLAESADSKQQEVLGMLEQAEKVEESPAERQYLLKNAAKEQEKLNADIEDVVIEEKKLQLERENQVELDTKEELEKKKRRFLVDIGDLTMEIERTEKEISSSKSNEKQALHKKQQALEDELDLTKQRLETVNQQLEAMEETIPVVSDLALDQEIGFNEERKLAASEEYEAYSEKVEEALELENQITNLENDLNNDRMALKALLERLAAGEGIQVQVDEKVQDIKKKQTLLDKKRVDLIQKKYIADALLPKDENKALKLQNLAIRGVSPIKTTAIAMAMLALPTDGLSINANAESVYSEENPIPVGVEAPKGLVYRVQIGAFRKQIPQDLFSEFNPVTGELIGNTGITRYMAGFFANSNKVVEARKQIRDLGYSDAFIVAYCDGKRIGFGDARRMEEAGTCVPQGESKLMLEVAENIADEMDLPVKEQVEELPDYSYAQAPGAAVSNPIELTTGLFFTVQVGVFSKPVTKSDLLEMEELFTIRLSNGTIRYNSGMFNSVEEAKDRRKLANDRGIQAFITAYFEGERITIQEAEELLAKRGRDILQTELAKDKEGLNLEYEVPDHIVRTDTVRAGIKDIYGDEINERMQIVTKKSFDEFPRDILNRYNTKGTFYFDEKDKKVKSVIVTNPAQLPRVYKFRDDVDTIYLDRAGMQIDEDDLDIISFDILTQIIPGDIMDWMMRFNYRREFELIDNNYTVRIFGIESDRSEYVLNEIRKFGYNPRIEKLSEVELELKE